MKIPNVKIKEKFFNFIKNMFLSNSEIEKECDCIDCDCNEFNQPTNDDENIFNPNYTPTQYSNLYDFIFNDYKNFSNATQMIAAHFASIELMEKFKNECDDSDFTPNISFENEEENEEIDIALICILGHQSDEQKFKFLKYLKDTYNFSFDRKFKKEYGYLYWAYILKLKKTFKFLLENGALRTVPRYEYVWNGENGGYDRLFYQDILKLISPSEKYFIKLLEQFENNSHSKTESKSTTKFKSATKSKSKTKSQTKKK